MTFHRLAAVAAILLMSAPAAAQDVGSLEEAQAMAEEAAALYETGGPEAAFDAFNEGGEFRDRDLYVFALAHDGSIAAHGGNESLVGRNLIGLRDPSGRQFIQEFLAIEETGWVEYQWQNPQNDQVEDKTSYIINVGDHVIGVGAYQQ